MPNTPRVNFNIINNNVEESSPTLGISTVIARTTKGPAFDPSKLITSISAFKRTFGSEIVPDGSRSNIEQALLGGSKLRIIRVVGQGSAPGIITLKPTSNGTLVSTVSFEDEEEDIISHQVKGTKEEPLFYFISGEGNDKKKVTFYAQTRGYGEPIGSGKEFNLIIEKVDNRLTYKVVDYNGSDTLDSGTILNYTNADNTNNTSIDYLAFSKFIQNNEYLKITSDSTDKSLKSLENVLNLMAKLDGTKTPIQISLDLNDNDVDKGSTKKELVGTIGTAESEAATTDDWKKALEYIRDYTDSYNIILSHIYQHLGNSYGSVYHDLKIILDELNEFRCFVEIPKYTTQEGGTIRDIKGIIQEAKDLQTQIGYSKWVSYFAGGQMITNQYGILQGTDIAGSILGLADTSATDYGYDKSFAGVNRGILVDAKGPVCPNYGSPGRIEDMEELAQACVNIICIKDTPSYGKRTILWHNFTSQVKADSFRFIGNTGLVLNIKKTLRPILESYIEEPNFWVTWKNIYYRVRPYISAWVDAGAMTDPVWVGDQDASSWEDLTINTEAEARQGKYKTRFSFKDIVAMQQINIDLVIDSASRTIDVDVNN